jgi:hypothetical protein
MQKSLIILLFILLIGCKTSNKYALRKSNSELQNENYKEGNAFLKKNKLENAYQLYHLCILLDEKSELSKICKNKIDSILPIIRSKKIKEWQGLWKIKELNFDPFPGLFTDYIEFKEDRIRFYKEMSNNEKKLIREETIQFVEYEPISFYLESLNLKFKNSEIWGFDVRRKNNSTRLYPTIILNSFGMGLMLHEPPYTKERRKEEEKKEKYTYYEIHK